MLIIVLIAMLILLGGCHAALFKNNAFKDNRLRKKICVLCIIAMVIIAIDIIALAVITHMTYDEKVQTKRYDSIGPIEQYVIGEEKLYTFFYQDSDKPIKIGNSNYPSIKICNINAENSTIYEQDIDAPYVIEYTVHTYYKLEDIWQYILLLGTEHPDSSGKKVYEIYVPTGTVQDLYQNVQDLT